MKKKLNKIWNDIRDFLNSDDRMPVWYGLILHFFAGGGVAYWIIWLIGKITGFDIGLIPKNK